MSKPVVLTVDDDADVLSAVARDLRKRYGKDYRVLRADSGATGLNILSELRDRGDHVALLLSDQRMPRMDGVGFLSKAMELHPRSKRALLTAYADTEAAISAINLSQVDYYLQKPWDPPEEKLYPVLDDMLGDWRAAYRPGYEGVRVVGDRWSSRSHAIRDFLSRNQIPYEFLDVETSDEARTIAADANGSLPLVFLPDGERLAAPEPSEVANRVGLRTQAKRAFYDLAIVGAGPAGLASSVYGGSEGMRTVLIEREAPGGQAGTSSRIENYLGFPSGLSGADLARRAVAQAKRFEVEMLAPQNVTGLRVDGPYKHLTLGNGTEIACHVLLLAMGVQWNYLPAEGANRLAGAGVYYGASPSEAVHCVDEIVYTVGAGNSAGQAALYIAGKAKKVVMVVRGNSLASKMSHYLVNRIESTENIEVRLRHQVKECKGAKRLESIELLNSETNEVVDCPAGHLFVFLGASPRTEWLDGIVARDALGFILTGPQLKSEHLTNWPIERSPHMLETTVPGIFAAGDARLDSVKRVASAVGEGSVAVYYMHQYLADR